MDDWQVRVNHAGEKLLRKGEDLEGMTDREIVTMREAHLAAEEADRAAVWKLAGILRSARMAAEVSMAVVGGCGVADGPLFCSGSSSRASSF